MNLFYSVIVFFFFFATAKKYAHNSTGKSFPLRSCKSCRRRFFKFPGRKQFLINRQNTRKAVLLCGVLTLLSLLQLEFMIS